MRGEDRLKNHTYLRATSIKGRYSSLRLRHTQNRGTPALSKRRGAAPQKNLNARAYVRLALFLLFFAMLAVSAGVLIFSALQDSDENNAFIDLAAYVAGDVSALPVTDTGAASTGIAAPSVTDASVLEKYRNLHAINPDMVGWIKIDGTPIDYPVMYTPEDGDFYLHHDFEGKTSRSGVPFIDGRCSVGQPGANIIIYGHNMKNGSMFGTLDSYKDEAWFQAHPIIQYDTLDEQGEYEIVAVFLSQVYNKSDDEFKFYNFFGTGTKSEFDHFYNNIKALSLYDTGLEAQFGDNLITLSTCDYHVDDGRLVIVARQIK